MRISDWSSDVCSSDLQGQMADIDYMDPRQSPRYIGEVPIPALPDAADYDLGLSNPTYFEAFRIFVPWIDFAQRGAGLPADFQINGPEIGRASCRERVCQYV